jgi:hypothetical protein
LIPHPLAAPTRAAQAREAMTEKCPVCGRTGNFPFQEKNVTYCSILHYIDDNDESEALFPHHCQVNQVKVGSYARMKIDIDGETLERLLGQKNSLLVQVEIEYDERYAFFSSMKLLTDINQGNDNTLFEPYVIPAFFVGAPDIHLTHNIVYRLYSVLQDPLFFMGCDLIKYVNLFQNALDRRDHKLSTPSKRMTNGSFVRSISCLPTY